MPAPPHDVTGHTWHHSDNYLFLITKYGVEEILGEKYPNNMPAYKDILTDDEIYHDKNAFARKYLFKAIAFRTTTRFNK